MKRSNKSLKRIRLFAIVSVLLIIYHFVARPWMLHWGAPEKIREVSLRGDSFTGEPIQTRAVLINATPEEVWPWIMQLGQERGGFYSYSWLENIFMADIHNVCSLQSELQEPRHVGDTIWMANRKRYGGQGHQIIAYIKPDESFVMVSGADYERIVRGEPANGSWSIYLYPENGHSTWLIVRSAFSHRNRGVDKFLHYTFFEVPHFVMEQKMLRSIRELAEKNKVNLSKDSS